MENTSKTKRILIAAEAGPERDDITALLSQGGHAIDYAANIEEGIEAVKANTMDIILLDLTVPALNGYAFLESLEGAIIGDVPKTVIVLGASLEDINLDKHLTLGVKDYVIKSSSLTADIGTKLLPFLKASSNENSDPLQAEGFKILVVEDDNFLRDLLARKLGQEDCQFIAAIDGENALKIVDEETPSIILLDLILPGIDGFEVLTKIKQNPAVKDVPVVILSNLGQDSDIKKAQELGADDFLIKANFSIDEVITKIKELVGHKK